VDQHGIRPERFRLFGKLYSIEWGPEATKDDYGEQIDLELKVRVCTNLPPDQERESLLHELLHAIDGALDIDRPEREHNLRSLGLYDLFKSNPGLAGYIFGA
jgi:hypothetical protein